MGAIYQPKGKAGEYAKYACNFYNGCSNDCAYCYCKRGILARTLGGDTPTLKKCFKDEEHALEVFEKDVQRNLKELQKHGLFFTFTSDPFLQQTTLLTQQAALICLINDVPVKFLTKRTDWHIDEFLKEIEENGTIWNYEPKKHLFAFGFTLTGIDNEEPNASTNEERIEAMRKLHDAGFKTWASIEPIIDINISLDMIRKTKGFCSLYKVGLMSGKKYDKLDLHFLLTYLSELSKDGSKIYIKDSVLKAGNIDRTKLPDYFVSRDYNIFNN